MSIYKSLVILLILFTSFSCSEDGTKIDDTINTIKDAKILSYQLIALPNLSFKIENLNITSNVPNGTNLTSLTAKFTLTDKAQLFVGSVVQVSEQTKNNFEQPLEYTLKDASNESKTYTVTINEDDNIAPIADAGPEQVGETGAEVEQRRDGDAEQQIPTLRGPLFGDPGDRVRHRGKAVATLDE